MSKKEILEALGINLEKEEKSDSVKKISAKEFLEAALGCSFGDKEPEIEKVVKVEITPKSPEEIQKDLCEIFGVSYGKSDNDSDTLGNSECQCAGESHECQCSKEGQQRCQCSESEQREPEEPLAQSTTEEPLAQPASETVEQQKPEEPLTQEEEEASDESSFASKLVSLLVDEVYDLMNDKNKLLIESKETLKENLELRTAMKDFEEQNLALSIENEKLKQERETLASEVEGLTDTYKNLSRFITKFLEGHH